MGEQLPKSKSSSKTWVVFELTYHGEKAAVTGELLSHLTSLFQVSPDQVFIPYILYTIDNQSTLLNVMEGYCFLEYVLDAKDYITRIQNSKFLRAVLHSRSGYQYVLHTVQDSEVTSLREKLHEMTLSVLSVGDTVCVISGLFEGMSGVVLEIFEREVCLYFKLRSFEAVRILPRQAISLFGGRDE